MDSGFVTRIEAGGDLVIQTHWGDTTPEMKRQSGIEVGVFSSEAEARAFTTGQSGGRPRD